MPIISIIVPVYKVEPYLRRCVDSVLNQSFTDYDLILVDDGSPDRCGAICDEYAEKDARVHVLHQENGGLSAARNAGIDWAFANSDSQWLTFIDSDDWVHPAYLEYLYSAVMKLNGKLSCCCFARVKERQTDSQTPVFQAEELPWDSFYLARTGLATVACCKLYQKELFRTIRFPVGKIHEDEFVTYQVLYQAGSICFLPLDLYYYFENTGGIILSPFSLKKLDKLDAIEQQCVFARKIHHEELFQNRLQAYTLFLATSIGELLKSEYLDKKERKIRIRQLRKKLQHILIRFYGYVPLNKTNGWKYNFAFPLFSRLYWSKRAVVNRLTRK